MKTNSLLMSRFKDPSKARVYLKPEFKPGNLLEVAVVENGTVEGNSTIDLVFEDPETGQKFVAMTTARLLRTAIAP